MQNAPQKKKCRMQCTFFFMYRMQCTCMAVSLFDALRCRPLAPSKRVMLVTCTKYQQALNISIRLTIQIIS